MDRLGAILAASVERFPTFSSSLTALALATKDGIDIRPRSSFPKHVTASACMVDRSFTQTLMIFSPKFGQWLLPGGHIEAGEMPQNAARREAAEECGISIEHLSPLFNSDVPQGIDEHWIEASSKKNEPRHLHVDLQYVFLCRNDLVFRPDPPEVENISWHPVDALYDKYEILHRLLTSQEVKSSPPS